jgi:hypothetical protein
VITVRIPMREAHANPFNVEVRLHEAGVPPILMRTGMTRASFDAVTDEWVFEYTALDEAMSA